MHKQKLNTITQHFIELLTVGGKSNSLGEVPAVIDMVLGDKTRLEELYLCLFDEDAWVRMRAADALEKICRVKPTWLLPYIDRFARDFSDNTQSSIRWHLAQIYSEVDLTPAQQSTAAAWLERLLSSPDIDWIVASNAMDTLAKFTRSGYFSASALKKLLTIQQQHTSQAVRKRANMLLKNTQQQSKS